MKRFITGLLPGLLLAPTLVQAYSGTSTSSGEVVLFLLLLLTPLVLPPVLVIWACRKPENRGLQVMQGLALLFHAWLWCYLSSSGELRQWGGAWLGVYLEALLPLALLFNGLAQARLAAREPVQLLWVGAAVVGGQQLLWQLWRLAGIDRLVLFVHGTQPLNQFWSLLLGVLVALCSWSVVLRHLRHQPEVSATLWQQSWWRAPLLAGSIAAVYALVEGLSYTLFSTFAYTNWPSMAWGMLVTLLIVGVAGVAALRLVSPLPLELAED
jgi:hypothetical protein